MRSVDAPLFRRDLPFDPGSPRGGCRLSRDRRRDRVLPRLSAAGRVRRDPGRSARLTGAGSARGRAARRSDWADRRRLDRVFPRPALWPPVFQGPAPQALGEGASVASETGRLRRFSGPFHGLLPIDPSGGGRGGPPALRPFPSVEYRRRRVVGGGLGDAGLFCGTQLRNAGPPRGTPEPGALRPPAGGGARLALPPP